MASVSEVLQGAATKTRLEDFWRRVAAEWPEARVASCGAASRERVAFQGQEPGRDLK